MHITIIIVRQHARACRARH